MSEINATGLPKASNAVQCLREDMAQRRPWAPGLHATARPALPTFAAGASCGYLSGVKSGRSTISLRPQQGLLSRNCTGQKRRFFRGPIPHIVQPQSSKSSFDWCIFRSIGAEQVFKENHKASAN